MTTLSLTLDEQLVEQVAAIVLERLEQSRWLPLAGIADHFGVEERQVRHWRELGLPARRVGKRLMFSVNEVDEWLDSRPRR
jgi:hypothetical protein